MKLAIILPAFNEEKTIGSIIDNLKSLTFNDINKEIVVVNDGSTDKTSWEVKKRNVTLLNHILNTGLGGALQTGFAYVKQINADYAITFDSDGQHDIGDIKAVLRPLVAKQADVVIGSRMMSSKKMPFDRQIINQLANLAIYILWSIWITDTQSGLRGFTKEALSKIEIRTNRMEVSSEIIKEIAKNKLKVTEVPIKAIYTDYSKRKGQKNANALNILVKLLMHKFAHLK